MTALAKIGAAGLDRVDPEVVQQAAAEMAATYAEAEAAIRTHAAGIRAATARLKDAFPEAIGRDPFGIDFVFHGERCYGETGVEKMLATLRREAWKLLVEKLGVRDIMSVAKRKEFDEQLEKGDLPDITAASVMALLVGLTSQATRFATEAAKEVFDILRPSRHQHRAKYKTNSAFRVGKRVVLSWMVEQEWGGKKFRPGYRHEPELAAIDNVFHLLDGRGTVREGRPPLIRAILDSPDGKGETEYFRFRCFKNRNLHVEFKRLDLVKKLNGLAAGEYVLGTDEE